MKLFYHKIYCKKRSIALLLALTLCLAVVLGGCKKEEEPQPPPEPEDPNFPVELNLREKTVTIGEKPTAVVSLSPAITNTLLDMGMEEALAGVSQYCLSLPGAQGLQNCGTAQNVDLEAVKALAPQILFTDTPLLSQQLTALYQMNVEVVEITRPESIGAIEERQLLLAQALYGKEEGFQRGQAYQKQYHSRWEDIMEPLARWSQENNSLTAILLAYSNTTMATGDTFEGSLLEQLAFINLGDSGFNWQYQPKEGESLSPLWRRRPLRPASFTRKARQWPRAGCIRWNGRTSTSKGKICSRSLRQWPGNIIQRHLQPPGRTVWKTPHLRKQSRRKGTRPRRNNGGTTQAFSF